MKQQIERTWKHIAQHWSEERINKQHYEWKTKLRILSRVTNNNLILVSCQNCHSRVPGSWVHRADNVCSLCDRHVSPFVDNPVNRKYAEKYLEQYFSCFFISFMGNVLDDDSDDHVHTHIGDACMELKKWFKCSRHGPHIIVCAFFRSRAEQNAVFNRVECVLKCVPNPHHVERHIELDHDSVPPKPPCVFHTHRIAQAC